MFMTIFTDTLQANTEHREVSRARPVNNVSMHVQ